MSRACCDPSLDHLLELSICVALTSGVIPLGCVALTSDALRTMARVSVPLGCVALTSDALRMARVGGIEVFVIFLLAADLALMAEPTNQPRKCEVPFHASLAR